MYFSEYFKDAKMYLYILIYFSFSSSIFALSLDFITLAHETSFFPEIFI